jgi:hypothetical protein
VTVSPLGEAARSESTEQLALTDSETQINQALKSRIPCLIEKRLFENSD